MVLIATEGQSLLDFAVQYFGDESRVFELASLNDLSVTHQFVEDTSIELPESSESRATAVLAQYRVQVRRLGQSGHYVLVDENGDYPVDENGNVLEATV